jgi:hypothetical protein
MTRGAATRDHSGRSTHESCIAVRCAKGRIAIAQWPRQVFGLSGGASVEALV